MSYEEINNNMIYIHSPRQSTSDDPACCFYFGHMAYKINEILFLVIIQRIMIAKFII